MARIRLTLYVCGPTARSTRAIGNLREVCENVLGDDVEVSVIDVLDHPDRAEADRVLATPTLVKTAPPPVRRIVGDLSDQQELLGALGIDPRLHQSNAVKTNEQENGI
jgi:circadian clock protein KaiB